MPTTAPADDVRLLTLDEEVWVAFYDLPSRRFRSIRDNFVQGEFEAAARDLDASLSFLRVEAERAPAELKPALEEVIDRLEELGAAIESPRVTVADLDAVFARTHWLLTQQYFVLALRSRDEQRHRNAGHYLWATAHHLERSVLWSNARIDRRTVSALESLRDMAARLRDERNPQSVYRERPIRLAARTIVQVGEHLDRNLRIRKLIDSEI
ncbi:MAG: hypothetical protein R3315_12595 [Woeseiaceae bacterium]|nr:hypothetical protein [Woeseiaceae bacterium]